MKGKLQQFSVKLLASTLAVIMSIPANAFAMVGDNSNTYTENTSVMGIQAPEETKEDQAHTALLKSELGTVESNDYIIKKSASLSKTLTKHLKKKVQISKPQHLLSHKIQIY